MIFFRFSHRIFPLCGVIGNLLQGVFEAKKSRPFCGLIVAFLDGIKHSAGGLFFSADCFKNGMSFPDVERKRNGGKEGRARAPVSLLETIQLKRGAHGAHGLTEIKGFNPRNGLGIVGNNLDKCNTQSL